MPEASKHPGVIGPTAQRPIAYLASPYSSPSREIRAHRFVAATRACGALLDLGVHAYSPIVHSHSISLLFDVRHDWEFWKAHDTSFISVSWIMYILAIDGWEESVGIKAEREICKEQNIPTVLIDIQANMIPEIIT